MPRKTKRSPVVDGAVVLDADAQTLKRFYAGSRLESPMGGFLDPIGVRASDDGQGIALFECTTSSLRFTLTVPKATRRDKEKVKAQLDEGIDPYCPRHGFDTPLQRVGNQLACPRCGVAFRRAPR